MLEARAFWVTAPGHGEIRAQRDYTLECCDRTIRIAAAEKRQPLQVLHLGVTGVLFTQALNLIKGRSPLLLLDQLHCSAVFRWILSQRTHRNQQRDEGKSKSLQRHQNPKRAPSWIDRGVKTPVALPKLPLVRSPAKLLRLTRLNRLYTSARN